MTRSTKRECVACFLAIALFGVSAPPARAGQPTPVGDALLVNETIIGRQLNGALAALGNGNMVVVWEGEDADGRGVVGRVVDASGLAVASEFPVSVTTTGNQVSAEVTARGDGGFIVVWENDLPGQSSISMRTYDAGGVPGPELDVAPFQAGINVLDPAISRLSDGSFVVIWDEFVSGTSDGSVRARFLDAAGSILGGSFIVPTGGAGSNVFGPEMASRPGGGFVVTWDYDGSPDGLWAQAFTNAAASDGPPIEITGGSFGHARLTALDDGGFLTVWRSGLSQAMRRRVDSRGVPSPPVEISSEEGLQQWTDVAALPGGQAALTWTTLPPSDPQRIDAQLIGSDGSVVTAWPVATSAISLFRSRIAYDAVSGHVVLLWTERFASGGDQEDVFLQRYDLGLVLFSDGFESGDVSAWSDSLGF